MRHASPLALAALSALSLAACHPVRMAVPADLHDDVMNVSRSDGLFRAGRLAFGGYYAREIHHGWTFSESTRIWNAEETASSQKFRFDFGESGSVADKVRCESVYASQGMHFGGLTLQRGRHGLGCNLYRADGAPEGQLVMTERERERPYGQLVRDGVVVELIASGRFEGGRVETFEPVGFDLLVGGVQVGAVQVMNGGQVWIERNAPADVQAAAAVAAATLLLYQPLEG